MAAGQCGWSAATDPRTAEGWALVALKSRETVFGRLSQATVAGVKLLRIDLMGPDELHRPMFVAGAAVFSITPVTEDYLRELVARSGRGCAVPGLGGFDFDGLPQQIAREELIRLEMTVAADPDDSGVDDYLPRERPPIDVENEDAPIVQATAA